MLLCCLIVAFRFIVCLLMCLLLVCRLCHCAVQLLWTVCCDLIVWVCYADSGCDVTFAVLLIVGLPGLLLCLCGGISYLDVAGISG